MSDLIALRNDGFVTVKSPYWTVVHDASQGGCWTSVTFTHGSGRNLLTAPVSARVRNLEAHPKAIRTGRLAREQNRERNTI